MAAEYSKVYYAVRITTGIATTDAKIGMDTGIITYVTERIPSDRAAVDADTAVDYLETKYDGFLVKSGINPSSNSIDIVTGGDFSTLGNFAFTIKNRIADDSGSFHLYAPTVTDLYLTGSKVQFFICFNNDGVTPDTWYSRWSGFVSTTGFDEKTFKFNCSDNFIQDLIPFPPEVVGKVKYPNAPEVSVGKAIPVCLGDVRYAKPVTVSNSIISFTHKEVEAVLRVFPNVYEDRAGGLDPDAYARNQIPDYYAPLNDRGRDSLSVYSTDEGPVYMNGYTYCLVVKNLEWSDPTFNPDAPEPTRLGYYTGKYLVFTKEPLGKIADTTKEEEQLKIRNSAQFGDYLYIYVNKLPDFVVDRTNFYGEGFPEADDPDYNSRGELTTSNTFFFAIVEFEPQVIISNRGIHGLYEEPDNAKLVLPDDGYKAYFPGTNGGIPFSLQASNFDLGSGYKPSTLDLSFNSYNNGGTEVMALYFPEGDKTYWYNNKVDDASTTQNKAYAKFMLNACNKDNTTSDYIYPGSKLNASNSDEVTTDQLWDGATALYKANIDMNFDPNVVDPASYDTGYVVVNMMSEHWLNYTDHPLGTVVRPCRNFDATKSSAENENSGNLQAKCYQLEVRNSITTADGPRYTQNYNDIAQDLVSSFAHWRYNYDTGDNESMLIDGLETPIQRRPRLNIVPVDLIAPIVEQTTVWDWENGYQYFWPRQPRYTNHEPGVGRYLLEGTWYDTKDNLEIDLGILGTKQVRWFDGMTTNELTLTITPHTFNADVALRSPTWDLLRVYNLGILLTKKIDPSKDTFVRVHGEVMYGAQDVITMSGTQDAEWDGDYVLDPSGSFYECVATGAFLYPSPLDPNRKLLSTVQGSAGSYYSKYGSFIGSWTPATSGYSYGTTVTPPVAEVETNNVYTCLKHILGTYNGLEDVDYGNLPTTRDSWNVGRQISTTQNSIKYLQELCAQSFITGYVNRKGSLSFKAFREEKAATTTAVMHDSSNIIKGSIKNFKQTPVTKVYNNINVEFNYDATLDKYSNSYSINRVEEPEFPPSDALDDSGNLFWTSYISGFSSTSYPDAKAIWDKAHQSYLETRVLNKPPTDISQLLWAGDKTSFYNDGTLFDRSEEYAAKYFDHLSDWATRQKLVVEYELALTPETAELDLMQLVYFSDPIITGAGQYAVGWVTRLDFDPAKGTFDVELTFEQLKTRWPIQDVEDIIEDFDHETDIIEDIDHSDDINEGV